MKHMKVKVDKQTYTGTPKQIVRKMWQSSFDDSKSKDDYMLQIAHRINVFEEHSKLTVDNYESFLYQLVELGLITIEVEK